MISFPSTDLDHKGNWKVQNYLNFLKTIFWGTIPKDISNRSDLSLRVNSNIQHLHFSINDNNLTLKFTKRLSKKSVEPFCVLLWYSTFIHI